MTKLGIQHLKIPHPSRLNRQWNDPKTEITTKKRLKKYLQKHRQSIPNRNLLGRVSDITVEVLLKIYKKNGYGEDRFIVLSDVLATVTD